MCDYCKKNESNGEHVYLKLNNVCKECSRTVRDDIDQEGVRGCEGCGKELLECECQRYTIRELKISISEIYDLSHCLHWMLENPEVKKMNETQPQMTLTKQIIEKLNESIEILVNLEKKEI